MRHLHGARRLVGVVGLVAGLGACQGDDGYGEATERAFLRACVRDGGDEERAICQCSYDAIVREIPYRDYRTVDRRVRDDPDALPDEIADIVAACAAAQEDGEG